MKCEICGRKPKKTLKRSHSNIATIRRQYLNLQTKRIKGKKVKICTKCLKTESRKGFV